MSKLFLTPVEGGWIGKASTRFYSAPRECEESAEAQEREFARRYPRQQSSGGPTEGSAEEARWALQQDSLENIDLIYLDETKAAYQQFCVNHPEWLHSEDNLIELCEFFKIRGTTRFVLSNDSYLPLAVTPEMWEEAYQWKMAAGKIQVNPSVMSEKQRIEAQLRAQENAKRGNTSEEQLYDMPMEQLRAMGFGR